MLRGLPERVRRWWACWWREILTVVALVVVGAWVLLVDVAAGAIVVGYVLGSVFQPWWVRQQEERAAARDRERREIQDEMDALRDVFAAAIEWYQEVGRRVREEGLGAAEGVESDPGRERDWRIALMDEDLARVRLGDESLRQAAQRAVQQALRLVNQIQSASDFETLQGAALALGDEFREALKEFGRRYREA